MRLRQDAARREFFFEVSRAAKPSTEISSCKMSDRQATKAPKDLKSVGRSCCRRDACVGDDVTLMCCAAAVDHGRHHACLTRRRPQLAVRRGCWMLARNCNCQLPHVSCRR